MRERRLIAVEGVVQGVGFRPWVHGLAVARGLSGHVRNDSGGVRIDVEGEPADLDAFLRALSGEPPPLARVHRIRVRRGRPRGARPFHIESSRPRRARRALAPADTATCADCLRELFDPADRRFRYPFLNCTRCGPRLTIIRELPYDRARTTMAGFPMCEDCRREYEDPADRRFHAQPTACPACGPRLALWDARGRALARAARVARRGAAGAERDPLLRAVEALADGRVVAVKGLGGWHLACDAGSSEAVGRLRARKRREAKPLALMVANLTAARSLCQLEPAEEALLASARAPIVLLRARSGLPVAEEVAPGAARLGLMLPYTPLHHLLAAEAGRPLVLTSGNRTEEPIAWRDEDALKRLAGVADLFLAHDRPIESPAEDSVWMLVRGGPLPIRRSRGWAPEPVELPVRAPAPILAVGGQLKNSFCFARGARAFPGPHLGDLENLDTFQAFQDGIERYGRLLGIRPAVVAHDLHPAYLSTGHARALAEPGRAERGGAAEALGVRRIGVQHHHAHVAGCLAEHGETGPAIGIAFDGTGYGTDGTVWGGELLVADLVDFERAAHLAAVPLPGGEAAVREPWRMGLAHAAAALPDPAALSEPDPRSPLATLREAVGAPWDAVLQLLDRPALSPPTSSVGRLFDAVSALLGLCRVARYEGEAAVTLETAARAAADRTLAARGAVRHGGAARETAEAQPAVDGSGPAAYPLEIAPEPGGAWIWNAAPIVRGVLEDLRRGRDAGEVALRFHHTLRDAAVELCGRIRASGGPDTVALTGGCFQNGLLTDRTAAALEAAGFRVLLHRRLPPNDGGLSYGQAAVAAARLAAERRGGNGRRAPARRRQPTGRV